METMTATEASNKFGTLLDQARLEPVKIEKQGRDVAVMLSVEEYKRMEFELERLHHERIKEGIRQCEAGEGISLEEGFKELEERYS